MKKYFLTAGLMLSFCFLAISQGFEGKITYEISYPAMEDMDPTMVGMLPRESILYIKSDLSRMEMPMGMGMQTVTISDNKTKTSTTLMDMMGQKIAMIQTAQDFEKQKSENKTEIIKTKETKVIAGYNCEKHILKLKDNKNSELIVYCTKELFKDNSYFNAWPEHQNLEGFPMEYETGDNEMKMLITAKTVSKEQVPDSKFIIPPDYKPGKPEDLMKMMGK